MRKLAKRFFGVTCVLLFSCLTIWAQATGRISGSVTDLTGALLPGVEITVTNTGTGAARTTVTNETGSYVVTNLPLGSYQLESALPGFQTHVQTAITLQVDVSPTINVIMQVGEFAQTIEVQANTVRVETRNVGVAQIMEAERILELPLNGRQVEDLITLSGAAVSTGNTSNRAMGGQNISVSGGLVTGVEYRLDDADHMNYTSMAGNVMPFPDALEEFSVRSSGQSAGSARGSGVSAVTKSGTNEFHGSAFWFLRDDLFAAREYFASEDSTLKRHQYGGTLGGPILRDRLFFFAGYQGTTQRTDPADVRSFLPTADMLNGDWTTFASSQCRSSAIDLDAPFVNNRIDPALFRQVSLDLVGRLPTTSDPCGEITYSEQEEEDLWQLVTRVDYQMSENHSLFGRYFGNSVYEPSPYQLDDSNLLNVGGRTGDQMGNLVALGSTYLVGPSMVNSLRFTYNRIYIGRFGDAWFSVCDVGVNIYCDDAPEKMRVEVDGGFSLSGSSNPDDFLFSEAYDISDEVSLIWGNHQVAVGGGLNYSYHRTQSNALTSGRFRFRGRFTGSGLSDFMLGQLDSFQQSGTGQIELNRWFPRIYVTDTWTATPTFTVSLGLRWEPFLPEQQLKGQTYNFDYGRFQQGVKSTVYPNAPAGVYYPARTKGEAGDPGFPNGQAGVNKRWAEFSPHVGWAWDVTGDGRTSVRSSYSYGFESIPMEYNNAVAGGPPFRNSVSIFRPVGGFEDPWLGVPGGNVFPQILGPDAVFPAHGEFITTPYDMKVPRTSTWNLSVQRELAPDSVLSATYLGSITTNIMGQAPLNSATYIPGGPCVLPDGNTYDPCSTGSTTNLRRRLSLQNYQQGQLYGALVDRSPQATQRYAGLLVSLRTLPFQGLNINTNYTWSHCLGDYQSVGGTAGADTDQSYSKPDDRRFDWGNCTSDRRHILNFTTVAQTPEFANPTLRMLASDWRLSVIYRVSSGSPLDLEMGEDRALTGTYLADGQRPNLVSGNGLGDTSGRPRTNYLDPDAFAVPELGTFGNLGRGAITGPKTWDFDMALARAFEFGEAQRVEFRAEAYNVTNSFRPTNPNADITNRNFGVLRNSDDARVMQFALRYIF